MPGPTPGGSLPLLSSLMRLDPGGQGRRSPAGQALFPCYTSMVSLLAYPPARKKTGITWNAQVIFRPRPAIAIYPDVDGVCVTEPGTGDVLRYVAHRTAGTICAGWREVPATDPQTNDLWIYSA